MNERETKNLDHPSLQPYRTLRRSVEHQRSGIFVAEGEKVVQRLIDSDLEMISVLMTREWLNKYRGSLESRKENIDVFVAEKRLLETIVGVRLHQGIMAVGRIPKPATLEEILSKETQPHLFVALDGLTNSENLGVLVRNCAAFGVQALFVGETSSSPYLRRAVRNSMGAVFKLSIVQCERLTSTIQQLRKHNIRIIGAHPRTATQTLSTTNFKQDCCLVFGSEGSGLSESALELCDETVAIPMLRGVDSLNVASASAVFFFEVSRQRAT